MPVIDFICASDSAIPHCHPAGDVTVGARWAITIIFRRDFIISSQASRFGHEYSTGRGVSLISDGDWQSETAAV